VSKFIIPFLSVNANAPPACYNLRHEGSYVCGTFGRAFVLDPSSARMESSNIQSFPNPAYGTAHRGESDEKPGFHTETVCMHGRRVYTGQRQKGQELLSYRVLFLPSLVFF
jgi:hypothetical protein